MAWRRQEIERHKAKCMTCAPQVPCLHRYNLDSDLLEPQPFDSEAAVCCFLQWAVEERDATVLIVTSPGRNEPVSVGCTGEANMGVTDCKDKPGMLSL